MAHKKFVKIIFLYDSKVTKRKIFYLIFPTKNIKNLSSGITTPGIKSKNP